jgi:CheY-like chemotaxis protein
LDLEEWWNDTHSDWIRNNKNITIVCPHPNYIFKEKSMQILWDKISASHDITIQLENDGLSLYNSIDLSKKQQTNKSMIRILIAEPEPDLRNLYSEYLNGLGIEVMTVENGIKCLENLFDSRENYFDMIILDSHIRDVDGCELVKKIHEKIPGQRIVLTTTNSSTKKNNIEGLFEIEQDDILLKPFSFTKLLAIIRPDISTSIKSNSKKILEE